MNDARLNLVVALTVMVLAAWGLAGSAQEASSLQASVFDRTTQPGEVARLDLTCACDAVRATATVFASDVPLFRGPDATVWHGLIGIDVETAPGMYPIRVVVDRMGQPPLTTTRELHVVAKQFPTRRLRVASHFVNPPASAMKRIQGEAQRLQTLFATVTPRLWPGSVQAPLAVPATGNFGTRSVFNGQPRSPHAGVDFRSRAGPPVAAPGAGSVAVAEPLFFTGNTVVIDHGLGVYSLLAHLSRFAVEAGDSVQRGQIVGFVGATGRVTGPHLHWAVRVNGARVDPLSLIAVTEEWKERSE